MKRMWNALYEEFLLRQIYWAFYDYKNKKNTIENMLKNGVKHKTEYKTKIKLVEEETLKNCIKEGLYYFKGDNKTFIDILKKEGIYDQIIGYLFGFYDIKYLKEKVINEMDNKFNIIFNKLKGSIKGKILNILFQKNKVFYEFFEITKNGKELYEKELAEKEKELIKILIQNERNAYSNKTADELINDEEFLKCVYRSQRGNNLLLITFFAQKKIEEKGFINELEKIMEYIWKWISL